MKYEWEAVVYHPSLPDGRRGCKLTISGQNAIGFVEGGERYTLDLKETRLSLGGTANNLLYFRSDRPDQPVFTVRDRSIVTALEETGLADIAAEAAMFKKSVWAGRVWVVWSLVTLVASLLVLFTTILFFGVELAVMVLPYSVDQKVGEITFSQAESFMGGKECQDPKITEPIQSIVDRLLEGLEEKPFSFDVRVYNTPINNAVALPGGKIIVTTSLIEASETPEEVAGVLAHEIMHAVNRHGLKKMMNHAGTFLLARAIFGDTSGLTDVLLDRSKMLLQLSYGRDSETEADTDGTQLLKNAHIDPQGLKNFFIKLQKLEKGDRQEFLSTHPLTEKRIKHLDTIIKNMGSFEKRPLEVDWQTLKKVLQERRK